MNLCGYYLKFCFPGSLPPFVRKYSIVFSLVTNTTQSHKQIKIPRHEFHACQCHFTSTQQHQPPSKVHHCLPKTYYKPKCCLQKLMLVSKQLLTGSYDGGGKFPPPPPFFRVFRTWKLLAGRKNDCSVTKTCFCGRLILDEFKILFTFNFDIHVSSSHWVCLMLSLYHN